MKTLRATLPNDANPAMVSDLYDMLGLRVPDAPGVTVTTNLVMHTVPVEAIPDLQARLLELFPGVTFEVTEADE